MKKRPLKWIQESTPDEIGRALLDVDHIKAAKVCAYLAASARSETVELLERVQANLERDPLGSIVKGLKTIAGS